MGTTRRRQAMARLALASLLPMLGCHGADAPPATGKGGKPAAAKPALEFPVEVEPAAARRVDYDLSAVGAVEAFEVVQVTARVAGVIERVRFAEGTGVKAGESLADIEPARFGLDVDAARAALERAEAQLAEAEAALARRETAGATTAGIFSPEEVESWRTRARTASTTVATARVALQQAQLRLDDARVPAPAAGVIQTKSVQTGQYVEPGDMIATLVRRDPLLLRFTVDAPGAARLAPGMAASFRVGGQDRDFGARIVHVAAQADATSRMVTVTAHVDSDGAALLRPGAFAQVRVPVGSSEHAVVVPESATRPSERGFLVFVVEDGVAHERVAELGLRTKEGAVEVLSGIRAGEVVVVRGAEALREGARVRVVAAAAASGAPAAATGATAP